MLGVVDGVFNSSRLTLLDVDVLNLGADHVTGRRLGFLEVEGLLVSVAQNEADETDLAIGVGRCGSNGILASSRIFTSLVNCELGVLQRLLVVLIALENEEVTNLDRAVAGGGFGTRVVIIDKRTEGVGDFAALGEPSDLGGEFHLEFLAGLNSREAS